MPFCNRCTAESKIFLPYGSHNFCAEHFLEFFERRVRKTTRMNGLVKPHEKIAVGVSGGKDSMTTLFLLNKIFGKGIELHAIIIDEGIEGYRDKAVKIATEQCEALEVDYTVVRQKQELGYSTDELAMKIAGNAALGASTCSFCGVFRRHILNKYALELSADKLATGHNLDDECQSIVMNIFNNDIAKLARLGPIVNMHAKDGMVPRIKPLYECPEKEIIAFAAFAGIEHYSEECCPHSYQARRNAYREMLNKMEEQFPGTKFAILGSFEKMKPGLQQISAGEKVQHCEQCEMPSSGKICNTCSQLAKLQNYEKIKTSSKQKDTSKTCLTTKTM